jgi:hypothetical protein
MGRTAGHIPHRAALILRVLIHQVHQVLDLPGLIHRVLQDRVAQVVQVQVDQVLEVEAEGANPCCGIYYFLNPKRDWENYIFKIRENRLHEFLKYSEYENP